jgi:hypothetical protein
MGNLSLIIITHRAKTHRHMYLPRPSHPTLGAQDSRSAYISPCIISLSCFSNTHPLVNTGNGLLCGAMARELFWMLLRLLGLVDPFGALAGSCAIFKLRSKPAFPVEYTVHVTGTARRG